MTDLNKISSKILPVLKRYGIVKAAVFGSFARGDVSSESDLDILVEIERDISLLDFVDCKLELEELLQRKVDLVEYTSLKNTLRDRIMREQVQIL